MQSIDNYQDFWRDIVVPDYNDFVAKVDDLRRAFHCAITLFHLSDWIYVAHKPHIDVTFMFRDKDGVILPVCDEKTFANALRDQHPDFQYVRSIANHIKHLKLRQPSNASNIKSDVSAWGKMPWGQFPWNGSPHVTFEGPQGEDLPFFHLATSTYNMWKSLAQQHNWKLI